MVVVAHVILSIALLSAALSSLANKRWLQRNVRYSRAVRRGATIATLLIAPCAVACALGHPMFSGTDGAVIVQIVGWTTLAVLYVVVHGNLLYEGDGGEKVVTRPRRVLAIGAHPDDLELGCGATLARWVDAGFEVHGLVMSNGEQGGDATKRPEEAHSAAKYLGATSVTVLSFPDMHLGAASEEMIVAIEKLVQELGPDIILTHSHNDTHQDHQAVHLATLRAARFHPSLLCYESPSATMQFQPTYFVDISEYLDIKVEAIATHRDQEAKPYMSAERIRAIATYRGGQAKIRHAEGYEPVRLLSGKGASRS